MQTKKRSIHRHKPIPLQESGRVGYKKLPGWLKIAYRRSVGYTCELCKRHEEVCGLLTPHRIIRGYKGGLYTVVPLNHKASNIKMLCLKCHKLVHGKEFT